MTDTPLTADTLMTADQLAERWQVPVSAIYRLSREKKIPVVQIGRYYRYRLEAVEDYERKGRADAA